MWAAERGPCCALRERPPLHSGLFIHAGLNLKKKAFGLPTHTGFGLFTAAMMSEEVKEKSTGKLAHRKKKAKKVND